MAFTWRPHDIVIDSYTKTASVKHVHDSVCFMHSGVQLYIQHGQVYDGGAGPPLSQDQLPSWFWDQARALTPEARRACGFTLPEDEVRTAADLPADFLRQYQELPDEIKAELNQQLLGEPRVGSHEKAPEISPEPSDPSLAPEVFTRDPVAQKAKTWCCPHCDAELPLSHKGVHMARFKKNGRCS